MSSLGRRRSAIVLALAASVVAAVLTIRIAATWTASAAPMSVRPPDAAQLIARLEGERERAHGLVERLAAMSDQAEELRVALAAARDKARADAATAEELTGQLERARQRLSSLQEQLAAAAAVPTVTITAAGTGTTILAQNGGGEGDEADEDDHDADEEDR